MLPSFKYSLEREKSRPAASHPQKVAVLTAGCF